MTKKTDHSHYLYVAVVVAVGAGILVGLVFPTYATQLKPLSDGFIALITMMIAPIIFCTIALVRKTSAKVFRIAPKDGWHRWPPCLHNCSRA